MLKADRSERIGIVAGGGTLPFAVARAVAARGKTPVLLAIEGYCDPSLLGGYEHHWVKIGRMGRILQILRAERLHEIVCVGSLVRPALSEILLDWQTIRILPALITAFRGGDDHLLTGVARLFEKHGLSFVGIADVAPELTMPDGSITRRKPDETALRDIAKGRAVLAAMSSFDIGQAVVVIDGHVIALEDLGGTDALLGRIARMRSEQRLRAQPGRGVLIKMPKAGQDLRFDLPAIGPRTVEEAAGAGLAGIATVAGRTLIAEPETVVVEADRAGIFVAGFSA